MSTETFTLLEYLRSREERFCGEAADEIERLRALLAPRPVRVWLRNHGQDSAHYGELVKIEDYPDGMNIHKPSDTQAVPALQQGEE